MPWLITPVIRHGMNSYKANAYSLSPQALLNGISNPSGKWLHLDLTEGIIG